MKDECVFVNKKKIYIKEMEHASCLLAINKMKANPEEANVHTNKEMCKCTRQPSPCDWVGNSMHYACLHQEYENPAKVYGELNTGGIGKIILSEEKIQK